MLNLLMLAGASHAMKSVPDNGAVTIYGSEQWYKSRTEPEQRWRGVLGYRRVTPGPGSRTALSYALITGETSYPVYSAGNEARFAAWVDRRLDVIGKLVDLSD